MKIKQVDSSKRSVAALLTALQQTCLPYDKLYETDGGYWWTATDDSGVACGFAGLAASVRWGDTGYLCRAGVIPSHRGQGLQKKLIRIRIRKAKALGWQWLVTDTYHNPASANSLIACGFKMFEPSIPWGARGTLYWRRKV
jgi:GNAT superfamily N-acetyltransferase